MRLRRRSPAWVWPKVALCLVVLDVILFRVGLFWYARPDFGATLASISWSAVYGLARELAVRPPAPDTAITVGSSVVWAGVDSAAITGRLRAAGLPLTSDRLTTFGQTCTDSALLVARALRLRPWLVVYGASVRDFNRSMVTDTPVTRIFHDASLDVPALVPHGAEAVLDANVKRYWALYRYRFFVRRALLTDLDRVVGSLAPRAEAVELPPEALRRFLPHRVTPESYAVWERWRDSRRFSDYMDWLRATGGQVLEEYRRQTVANFGPDGNPHVASLDWMLARARRGGVRAVVVYFPENPVFRDPEARPYFDPALSRAYAQLFAEHAALHQARFVDLRDLLDPEDFYDLIHPNLEGMRKITARLAEIIAEEWHARAAGSGPG